MAMRAAGNAMSGGVWSDEGNASMSLETSTRIFLTWPRALLLAVAFLLALGGRGSDFLLIVLALSLWYSRVSVAAGRKGLGLSYRLIDDHAFGGTTARVEVTVANRSRWPVPLLLAELRLPPGVHGRFRRVLTIGPHALHRYRFQITGLNRGVYRLGDTRVVLSDWFGLCEEVADVHAASRFVVYPPLPHLPDFATVRRLPMGPRRQPDSPFRDDLPVGVRPYQRGDPLKSIAWKASARTGELQVRELPPVRESMTWVFLDLNSPDWDAHSRRELTETAISLAGALVWSEQRAGRGVGFATWGRLVEQSLYGAEAATTPAWLRFPPKSDHGQALRVLEVLAAIRHAEGGDFIGRLRQEGTRLPWGARVVVLVPRDTPELWQLCARWVGTGHPVTVLALERRMGRPDGLRALFIPNVLEVHTRDGLAFE